MATQKGRNWSSGDIVTAANLQLVERGVSEVAEEYTPTTWANGDTVTAAGLNNIEQGIVNAGGGSLDVSTAEVTITNQSLSFYMTFNALYYDTESDLEIVTALLEQSEHYVTEWEFTSEVETDEYKFLIIEGFVTLIGDITMNENSVVVTGDIDKFINDQNLVELHIRGNGTITIP